MGKSFNKKGTIAIVALAVVILIGVIVVTVAISNMIKETSGGIIKEDTTQYTLAGATNNNEESSTLINWEDEENETAGDSEAYADSYTNSNISVNVGSDGVGNAGSGTGGNADSNNGGLIGNVIGGFIDGFIDGSKNPAATQNSNVEAGDGVEAPSTTKKSDKYDPIAEYEELTKNGDNVLSDHHNNKFIKLVSEKYGVDKELLVAIYSVPDNGDNFVLEFSGKRDSDGNVIKSPDTLTKVYQIDKNKNIAVATGKIKGNIGVSYAEGTLCFNMIKTIVMPQYPEYFTGVDK